MKKLLFNILVFLGLAVKMNAAALQAPDALACSSEDTTATVQAGTQVTLCWTYDSTSQLGIDGFKLYRSGRTKNNLDGMLGTFTQVAIIPASARTYTLSGSAGTYCYFLVAYKAAELSTASGQVKIVFLK